MRRFVVPLKRPPKRTSYTVSININDKNGNRLYRSATIIVP